MGLFSRDPKAVLPARQLTNSEVEQVRALTANDKLIQAVKLVRELTHLGLKDAKDIAEAIRTAATPYRRAPYRPRPVGPIWPAGRGR